MAMESMVVVEVVGLKMIMLSAAAQELPRV
jgi:hypothetical protein